MQLLNNSHIECIVNGHTFNGWADEDPPWEFEEDDSSEVMRGADGGMYVSGKAILGGKFRFKMSPSAPTTQWAITRGKCKRMRLNKKAQRCLFRHLK